MRRRCNSANSGRTTESDSSNQYVRGSMNYGTATETSSESGRFGDIGANVPAKLRREERTKLSTVKPLLACMHVAAEWALIAATIYLCQRFWSPTLYIFAVAFIRSLQDGSMVC